MRLSREVVDFVGLHVIEYMAETRTVGQVAVVELQTAFRLVGIQVERIEPAGVESRGAADDPVHRIALGEQMLCQVRPILSGDTGNDSGFHKRGDSSAYS